ncbi:MAG TPA: hypothetical protein PLT91_00565 [Clostridia bacterium]|nr:MAG: hypothetical protein BWX97_00240 [Firmicutes bacterium ADurb.Bin146]HOD92289.1 hypothetical protein [Clostridia bacterium]HQM38714.1 hypothetical protein [Clostridia bacterium]
MKKEKWYKFLYVVSGLLAVGFIIRLTVDYIQYNPMEASFPFYATILLRSVEFLLPALIVLIAVIILRKYQKKS